LFGLLVTGFVRFAPPDAHRAPTSPPVETPRGAEPAPSVDEARERALRERREFILETHARVVGQRNHFEVLGLGREATEAEVKAAYFRLVKQFHPDAVGELPELREAVQAVFARLGAAFEVLGQPKSRAAYGASLPKSPFAPASTVDGPRRPPPSVPGAPLPPAPKHEVSPEDLAWMAQESLKRAEEALSEGKYFDVINVLESQVSSLPGRARHRGRLVLAQAFLHNPQWLHRGEEQLRAVVREDSQNAEAYYLLGMIYKAKELRIRAASMFRKALELRPGHKPAADELASMEKAPPPPRRWFGGSKEG
jgi:curved DNA-binding protein CbpA